MLNLLIMMMKTGYFCLLKKHYPCGLVVKRVGITSEISRYITAVKIEVLESEPRQMFLHSRATIVFYNTIKCT